MNVSSLPLYFHSARHLKADQLAFFVARRFAPVGKSVSPVSAPKRREGVGMGPGVHRPSEAAEQFDLCFLNEAKTLDPKRIDWINREQSKLWRYNLHYFDYLHDGWRTTATCAALLDSWIANNPVGREDAWEPFTVSLRVVNWIKYFLAPERGEIKAEWLASLHHQALWLEKNLERHLLANHYFKNAKALVFAGTYFAGPHAERWLRMGTEILAEQMEEQILPDGGHFERSPMYHAMVLEDCLDLLNLMTGDRHHRDGRGQAPSEPVPSWVPGDRRRCLSPSLLRDRCRAMLRFLHGMSHPDGEIALFNDAAFNIEATPAALADYYERLTGERAPAMEGRGWSFPETGFYVMAPRPGDRLLIDCGPVGPDYQPGHSHCDTLSFELSLAGKRVVVDSGCAQYPDSPIRRYNRGNAGHNTVTVDGRNQSEVWGAHRCARRARPVRARLDERSDGALFFAGAHDGYSRLPGKPLHVRTVKWIDRTINIIDLVEGRGRHDVELRLHIHLDLKTEVRESEAVVSDGSGPLLAIRPQKGGRLDSEKGWYCPEFGRQLECCVIRQQFSRVDLPLQGGWILEGKR